MTTRAGLSLRYAVDPVRLGVWCSERFVRLGPDDDLASYVNRATQRRLGWWMSRWRGALGRLLSDFDANALLGAYPMHLLGTEQWRVLCGGRVGGRLLDVGESSLEEKNGIGRGTSGPACVRGGSAKCSSVSGPHAAEACHNATRIGTDFPR
jgi:hypothetical protein